MGDLRKLMLPYTALNFQEDPRNRKLTLSKYCQELALPMGVTHILAFSQTGQRLNLRLARTPEGPTITFRVTQFSLNKHIKALQRRPISDNSRSFHENPPIVVTNNFGDVNAPPQIKLLRITFQNMFPAINVATVRLAECRRVVLFHLLDEEEEVKNNDSNDGENNKTVKQRVQIRHYAIKATPVGVNRKVRRLIQTKVPNLSKVQDIADYITGQGGAASAGEASDSEAEDDPSHVVQLAQKYTGKGNSKAQKSALKLIEMGPRLTLELIKVEKGLGGGDIMYHANVHKSPEEAKTLKERKEQERTLKKQRREEQERNVERKRKAMDEKREAKKRRKEEREKNSMEALRQGGTAADAEEESESEEEESEEEPEMAQQSSSDDESVSDAEE